MTRFYCIFTAILAFGCGNSPEMPLPEENTPPAPACVEPATPPAPIEIRFVMRANGILAANEFTDACQRFKALGITCTEVFTPAEADIAISAFKEYDNCRRNAAVLALTEDSIDIPGLTVFFNCIPKENNGEWVREIFTNQLGTLFGIEGTPRFFGEGSFNFAVNQNGFNGPYHTDLTDADLVAWAYRWRSAATLGPKDATNYCGPPVNPISGNCAVLPPPEKFYTVKVWAAANVKDLVAAGCKIWVPVGVMCELSDNPDAADVHVNEMPQTDKSPAGFTYYDHQTRKWVISIRLYGDATTNTMIAAHELGHTFGMQHVYWWIAKAVMSPFVNQLNCVTEGDYLDWLERDAASSVIP